MFFWSTTFSSCMAVGHFWVSAAYWSLWDSGLPVLNGKCSHTRHYSNAALPLAYKMRESTILFEIIPMRRPSLPIVIFAGLASIAFAQSPTQLEPGKAFDRSLAAGGTDLFALDLKTDQIVQLTLGDSGKDVILSVYSPDGRLSRAFSSARQKGEALQFLATQPGRWRLKVAAREEDVPASYRISNLRINTPHPPALAEEDVSPRIRKITSQTEADVFWKEIGPNGSPLIEPIKDDPINRFTTFLWRGDADTKRVLLNFRNCSPIPGDCFLHHVEGTDVWYRTLRLDHRLRTTYLLTPNAPAVSPSTKIDDDLLSQVAVRSQRDPLNPKATSWDSAENPDLPVHRGSSILEMPDAPPQSWAAKRAGTPAGEIVKQDFASALLKNTRPIFVYLPPGYSNKAQPYHLLVVFDGQDSIDIVPTPTTLDNLISEKRIAPKVAVMVGNVKGMRGTELPCNPAFAEFLNSELIPWLRRNYNVTRDPQQVTIGGFSYGGLAATCAAYRHPETFGNVLSQSGSYWWTPPPDAWKPDTFAPGADPSFVAQLFVQSPKLPLRFYLDAGSMEVDRDGDGSSILVTNRHLRDVLRAKGYEVFYQEFQGAHDYLSWRGTIADGLILLGGKSDAQTERDSASVLSLKFVE
jgi:enterochelin esterase-like enzyme